MIMKVQEIGPFVYEIAETKFAESPDEGMTFVLVTLTVRNVWRIYGMCVSALDFVDADDNIHSKDWSVMSIHDGIHSDMVLIQIGLGNTVLYNLVYQVPEGLADGRVHKPQTGLKRGGPSTLSTFTCMI